MLRDHYHALQIPREPLADARYFDASHGFAPYPIGWKVEVISAESNGRRSQLCRAVKLSADGSTILAQSTYTDSHSKAGQLAYSMAPTRFPTLEALDLMLQHFRPLYAELRDYMEACDCSKPNIAQALREALTDFDTGSERWSAHRRALIEMGFRLGVFQSRTERERAQRCETRRTPYLKLRGMFLDFESWSALEILENAQAERSI